jgi:hypothetical protein
MTIVTKCYQGVFGVQFPHQGWRPTLGIFAFERLQVPCVTTATQPEGVAADYVSAVFLPASAACITQALAYPRGLIRWFSASVVALAYGAAATCGAPFVRFRGLWSVG